MLPKSLSVAEVDNTQWSSFTKLWMRLKIVRNEAKKINDPELISRFKKEEIEISRKIVKIAPLLTNGKGEHITVPFFPLLGNTQ